jgi:hypothetical protein
LMLRCQVPCFVGSPKFAPSDPHLSETPSYVSHSHSLHYASVGSRPS